MKLIDTITLNDLFGMLENEPENYVCDSLSAKDYDIPLEIHTCKSPGELMTFVQNKPIKALVKAGKNTKMVKFYIKNSRAPIIMMNNSIMDGNHRALAAHLAKESIQYIKLDEL